MLMGSWPPRFEMKRQVTGI